MKLNYAKIAANLARADAQRIEQTVKVGVLGGLSPAEIAAAVTGTMAMNGNDGITAVTRNHMMILARKVIREGTP
jgi:hypothetical protein